MAEVSAGWEELKDKGNAAFKAKEFDKAVEHFTDAIELNESHLLFSNRSGAYASLTLWKEALADAEKCVALNPTWAKGYGRKGAALEGLGQRDKAKEAYEAGLAHEPQSESLRAALANVAPRRAPSAGPRQSFPFGYTPPPAVVLTGAALVLNWAIVATTLFYMLPLFGPRLSFYAYRLSVLSCALKYARQLLAQFGLSRQVLGKWAEVKASESAHYLALSSALLLWRPVPFIILPMAARAVGGLVPSMVQQVGRLPPYAQALVRQRVEFAGSDEGRMLIEAFASTVRAASRAPRATSARPRRPPPRADANFPPAPGRPASAHRRR